jgi:hypothetical protein
MMAIGLMSVCAVAVGQTRPIVVELFTSQGCSSCPPAEKYLGELARRPEVLALSFHVDYWDELGWRDRFSSPEATRRQRDYAHALGLQSVYTPQAIVDGKRDFVGSNRAAIDSALKEGAVGVPVSLLIHDASVVVGIGAKENAAPSDVVLVAYLRSATSSIGRGENAGRTIQESNVVRSFRRIGRWQGSAQAWQARLDSIPRDATDVAILVQELPHGSIIGVAHIAVR